MKKIILISILFAALIVPRIGYAYTFNFQTGWNMISLPINTSMSKLDVLKGCYVGSNVFAYSATGYYSVSYLNPGVGYWVYINSPCSVSVQGNDLSIEKFPDLKAGYNLIGAPSSAIQISNVRGTCTISNLQKYNIALGTYEEKSTLEPGFGYWIKVNSDCKLGNPVVCTCTAWTPGSCGAGTCSSTQKQQTRTCNPDGCDINTQCIDDSSCATTCDSTCNSQGYDSGTCRSGSSSSLSAPTQFTTIANPRDGTGGKAFHNHSTLISMFKTLYDKYPGYASYEPIGKTYEGRDIVLFKIGNPNGGKVLWDGSIHGWEDVGSEVEYLISKWLLENGTTGKDSTAQKIIQQNLILFVPVINMDSYERQNRNFTSCSYGIDLNRNFLTGWSSASCGNMNYPGSSATSEKETQAMRNVLKTYKPDFYLNTHYGGGLYMKSSGSTPSSSGSTIEADLIQSIKQISSQRGVTPYSMSVGSNAGSGMVYGDAKALGAKSSWLIELNKDNSTLAGTPVTHCHCWGHGCDTYQDVINIAYPRMLPIFIAMANASAVTALTASCQTGETSVGQDGCSSGSLCCCLPKTTSDLVGYWKFDGNPIDSSGNNNNGIVNGATYTNGKIGNALKFSGTSNYVNISDNPTLDIINSITIQAWINTSSWPSSYPRIVSKESSTTAAPYALELNNSSKSVAFCLNTGAGEKCVGSGSNSISTNQWYHVVGTWNGTHSKIYINGQLKNTATQSGSMAATTNNVLIGNNPSKNRQFNGIIDEVKIWKKALTADDVLSEYSVTCTCTDWVPGDCGVGGCNPGQRQQTRTCNPDGCFEESKCSADSTCITGDLVGYWNFDDCAIKDSSGYENDGYMCGTNCQSESPLGTCTAVIVTGTAAEGGRSMLMKNRDYHDTPPKPYYYSKTSASSDGKYSFVFADMAGMSESGLAIMNTMQHIDSNDHLKTVQYHVHGSLTGSNKTYAMKYVLSHFSVVDDAVNWLINNLDSADCFGIIDQSSNKGAFLFIDGPNKTVQWVTNSYASVANNWVPDGEYGERRTRAMKLLNDIYSKKGYISWKDIAQNISRDQNGTDNTNGCYNFGDKQLISRNMTNANMIAISGNSSYGGKLNIVWYNFHPNSQVGIYMPIIPGALSSSSDIPLVFSKGGGLADLVKVKYNYAKSTCGDGSFNGTRVKEIHTYSFAAEDYAYNKYNQLMSTLPAGLSDTDLKIRLKSYMNDAVYFENKTYAEGKVPSGTVCTSCGTWVKGSCGGGGCGATERQYTRTGSPTGCYICPDTKGLSNCTSDITCKSSVTDGPNCITGKKGKAFSFDGINDYIDVGNNNVLNPSNAVSVSAWIYTRGASTTYPRIVSKESGIYADPYALELINSTNLRFYIGDGDTETGTQDINVNLLNTWVHVVGTYDGQYVKIYINGQLKGQNTTTRPMLSRTTKVLIGNNPDNDREFNGTIDEVKIWKKALTADEVLSEYNNIVQTINKEYILNYLNYSFYRYLGSDVFALTWIIDSYDILGASPPDRNEVIKFFDSKQNQTDGTWFSRTNHYVPITAQILMLYNRSGAKPAKSLETFFSRIDTWDEVKAEVQAYDGGNFWGGLWGYINCYVVYKGQAPPWMNEFYNEVNTNFDSWTLNSHQRTHLVGNLYSLNLPVPRIDEVILATLKDQRADGSWYWQSDAHTEQETVFNIGMLGILKEKTTLDKSLVDSAISKGIEYVKRCYKTSIVSGKTHGFFSSFPESTISDGRATALGVLTLLNPQSDVWTRWNCDSTTGYDFAIIGSVTKVPEIDNIYKMFNSLGITYKKLSPLNVITGSLNDVNGVVSFIDGSEAFPDPSVIKLFSQNHLVISHGYDFANYYYPSIKSSYSKKTSASTITYLTNAREFQPDDKTDFRRNDGSLEIFANTGLNTISNTVKIAQYNSTHTAIFHTKGLNSVSGFYVIDLKATRNDTRSNHIWNLFYPVNMVKNIPIGMYSSWIANGTNWPDLDWVNQHISDLASSNSDIAKVTSIGKTVQGRDIYAISIGKGSRHAVIDGCIHGGEKSGAFSAIRTAELLIEYYRSDPSWQKKLSQYNITIIPVLNPDGFVINNRTNANGKDLNRDFSTSGKTTQPETTALKNILDTDKPTIYINHHEGGCTYPFDAIYGNNLQEPYTSFTISAIKEANKTFTSLGHWGYRNCTSEGKGMVSIGTFRSIVRGGYATMAVAYASNQSFGINASTEILETHAGGAWTSLWALEAYPDLDINHIEHYDTDRNFLFFSSGFITNTNYVGTTLNITLDTDELTTPSTTRIANIKNQVTPKTVYVDNVQKAEGSAWKYNTTTKITTVTGAISSIRLVW